MLYVCARALHSCAVLLPSLSYSRSNPFARVDTNSNKLNFSICLFHAVHVCGDDKQENESFNLNVHFETTEPHAFWCYKCMKMEYTRTHPTIADIVWFFFHSPYFVTIKLVEIIALVLFLSCKRFIFLICPVSLNARIYCIGLYWWLNMIYEWAHFACIYFEEFFKIGCYGWWMRLEFMCATSALQTSMWKQYMFSLFVFFVFRFYFVAFVVIWMWTFYNELLLPFIRWVNIF